ncbi:hypothetical protein tb265_11500 [Gemmatimonadetes bacterium T265]|nr:hypothetical protein tb265_11500 [Gemmatimonadetes bacterium T265]
MPLMPSVRRPVLTYGLLAGAVLSALLVITLPLEDRIGPDRARWLGYATMVGALLLVFAAVRADRDGVAGGVVSFGRALAVGALTVLVASACYTATWEMLYFRVYRTHFLAEMESHALATLRARGASPAAVAAKRAELRRFAALYDNPAANAAITFLERLPVGLLIAVAAAATQRRRRPAPGRSDQAPAPAGMPAG